MSDRKPKAEYQQREGCPPDQHLRESDRLAQGAHFPRKWGEQKIYDPKRDCLNSSFGSRYVDLLTVAGLGSGLIEAASFNDSYVCKMSSLLLCRPQHSLLGHAY